MFWDNSQEQPKYDYFLTTLVWRAVNSSILTDQMKTQYCVLYSGCGGLITLGVSWFVVCWLHVEVRVLTAEQINNGRLAQLVRASC